MHTEKQAGSSHSFGTNPPRQVLLVEPDVVLRRVNTEVLIDSGYEVDAAAAWAVAWAALQLFDYGLLITDNNIPNVSGLDLLEKLHAAHIALPVILVSGTLPLAELKRNPRLQIDAALLKPLTPAELLATVRNVLRADAGACGPVMAKSIRPGQPARDRL